MINSQTVKALAEHVGGIVEGDGDLLIRGASTLSEAGPDEISFLANPKYEKELQTTKAAVIVVNEKIPNYGRTVIRCKDPYYAFMQCVVLIHGHREHEKIGVSERASIDSSAQIGEGVDIHDFTVVSADVTIGDQTCIYSNCTIGPGTKIGKECIIYPNVTIYDGCSIGDRCIIHSGTVIGQDGFGFATHDGVHHKIPQIGGVVIEDDVEIGANCAIDRGTLGDTVIGKGTKMSNLIAIGHNTRIGAHCLLVAQVGIAGSVSVGNYCVFGGQVGVVGHIKIGDRVKIGAQSGVTNNLDDGQMVMGSPAWPMNEAKRSMMMMKSLPDIRKKLKDLDRSLRQYIGESEDETE